MEISLQIEEPLKPSIKLWRYLDLTKFLDLILNQSIYLRRIDKFEDPYEGFISEAYEKDLAKKYERIQEEFLIADSARDRLHASHLQALKLMPNYAYASCWYLGNIESAAMWKLYGGTNNCVAICTTIYDLQVVFDESDDDDLGIMHLRPIRYVDESSPVDAQNYLTPMFEKRRSFSHENEFRALYLLRQGYTNLQLPSRSSLPQAAEIKNEDGKKFEIDVHNLINQIVISPTADPHFHSIVEKIIELAGFEGIECTQSKLYTLK